ncbi:GlxA family transcriptional regulator [Vibrio variabilis]|uniref:GlxA family transcriptional regulator n=1 Tax=Vibrio variabilis TaxID=990271 RepID=UPI000DDC0724|nr:helix-turn-helix domain-containing protein [Vibrio variabilis]
MQPYKVALVALNDISAFHLSVPCLVFQDVFLGQKAAFELTLCSEENQHVSLSSGFQVSVSAGLDTLDSANIIVIPSWPNHLPEPSDILIAKLITAHQRGAMVVGLCLGAYALAKAGLLDGRRATTHWGYQQAFTERFPDVIVDCDPLFIEQDNIITSAGTAASLDCCLHIVRSLCGSEVATQIARMMVTAPFRSGGQQQYIPNPIAKQPDKATSFGHVISDAERNLTQSYDLDSIAKRCAMSRRTFTRQFKAAYGCTFGEWLLNRRLALSQQLLESTDYSIATVAELSVFGSESVFRKHFSRSFDASPSQWRVTFKGE